MTNGETGHGRVLSVCTGNICRSPYIQGVLRAGLDRRWGEGVISVTSAGVPGLDGLPMDDQAAARLRQTGADPEGHRARRLTEAMLAQVDLVLTADRGHRAKVALTNPRALRRTFAYLDFADLASQVDVDDLPDTEDPARWLREVTSTVSGHRGRRPPLSDQQAAIIDPYGRSSQCYDLMAQQIDRATPHVLRVLTGD